MTDIEILTANYVDKIAELEKENGQLKRQIEKTKRFCSCEFCCHFDEEYTTEEGKTICDLCENKSKWELAE